MCLLDVAKGSCARPSIAPLVASPLGLTMWVCHVLRPFLVISWVAV